MRSGASIVLMRVFVAMGFLFFSQSATARGCGETLHAAELGTIAQALTRATQRLIGDVDFNGSRPIAGPGATGQSERIYRVLIPTMRLRAAVDHLSVLAQLRDLMHDPQDRQLVQGAIASFAARAADISAAALAKFAQEASAPVTFRIHPDISHAKAQVRRADAVLARCQWKGH